MKAVYASPSTLRSSTITGKPLTFLAAVLTSLFITCRYGSALFAWDMPIRKSLPLPQFLPLAESSELVSTLHADAAIARATSPVSTARDLRWRIPFAPLDRVGRGVAGDLRPP